MSNKLRPDTTLLQTKFIRPPVPKGQIVRHRLLKVLNSGLDGPLTLVVAPAGFGKTMLVSSWVQTLGEQGSAGGTAIPVAWLSLDERESDRHVFLEYFIGAIGTIFPGTCSQTFDLLKARQPPPESLVYDTLSNELELLPSRFIIVLDDLHNIHSRHLHDLLAGWVAHWPRHMHLVIMSRHAPPLPLATLRAKGQLSEIRSHDLRFKPAEAADYLRTSLAALPDDTTLALLHQRLEGWIAGLKMVTLSWGDRTDWPRLNRILLDGDIFIADYFSDEIFDQQTPGMQRFLLEAAIPDQFCVSLLKALHGADDRDYDVEKHVEELEAADLFVIRLDSSRNWYRFHQLFRDLLRQRLASAMDDEQVKELHRRAAIWFSDHRLPEQALHHALQAGEPELAADIMAQHLCDILNREDPPLVERWLRLLPESVIVQHPHLLILRAWLHGYRWELDGVKRTVELTEALLENGREPGNPQILTGNIAVLKGQQAYQHNQSDRAIVLCQDALSLLPEEWVYVRGVTAAYLAFSLQISGRTLEAERFLADQYETSPDKKNGFALRILLATALNHLQMGQLESAERTARLMLHQASEGGQAYTKGWAHYLLGFIGYQWNQLPEAEEQFAGVAGLRYSTQLLAARSGMIGQSLTLQALGRHAEAMAIIDQLSRLDLELHGYEQVRTTAARARLQLMQGNLEAAERWADSFTTPPADQPLMPWVDEPYLILAQILIARNQADDIKSALTLLEKLDGLAERTFNSRSRIEILALRAVALLLQGDPVSARITLIRSVELARTGNFVRVFVDLGTPMQKLLRQIADHESVSRSVRHILAAFPLAGDGRATATSSVPSGSIAAQGIGSSDNGLNEPLTPRELDVLRLLAEPISLKLIARRLNISYGTVRRYTINIYAKLDVHSRWEAVDQAVHLGLVPDK